MPLSRRLDDRHRVYRSHNFPKKRQNISGYRYHVLIGVGGNVGDTYRRLNHLWVYLVKLSQLKPIQSGVILRNPPFGYTEQNDFDNTVIEIMTSLEPKALLSLVLRIEKRFGRKRSFPNAPRTLDLDILFFDDRVIRSEKLNIPHPHWHERKSVTIPLESLTHKSVRRRS